PQHLADLRRSGISDEQIERAHLASTSDKEIIRRTLHWRERKAEQLGACLAFPYPTADGVYPQLDGSHAGFFRLKPDTPRASGRRKNRHVKYESPEGEPNHAYFPPNTLAVLMEPTVPLVFIEGEKKALKADQEGIPTLGLIGVDGWSVRRET